MPAALRPARPHGSGRRRCRRNPVTITLTVGLRTNSASATSRSLASWGGVLPAAGTPEISGVEIMPSGRTGTVTVNSGWFQTNICSVSPGPILYSDCSAWAWAGMGTVTVSGVLAHAASSAPHTASSEPPDCRLRTGCGSRSDASSSLWSALLGELLEQLLCVGLDVGRQLAVHGFLQQRHGLGLVTLLRERSRVVVLHLGVVRQALVRLPAADSNALSLLPVSNRIQP